jgi:tripartite-type tricarboxylate transporter receptor subunit TctC
MKHSPVGGALALAFFLVMGLQTGARAETYPDRSVRMVVAFAAGGTLDTLARIIGQKLAERWGQSVFVENRPGAGGNIGAASAAQAAPDGYVLHFGAQSLAVNVTIAPAKGFDPERDFEPVILVATAQDVLMVPPDSPAHSVKELIAMAKAKPGTLNYASLGTGSSGHLATVMFSDLAHIKLQHVPYSSFSQAVTDIMAGRLSLWIATLGGNLANIKAGKIRALAVSGQTRSEQLPDVPTFKEIGVPFVDETSWYGIFVPKGTSKEVVARINADVNDILGQPDMKERAATLGYRLLGGPPEKLGAMLHSEIAKWREVAKSASLVAK